MKYVIFLLFSLPAICQTYDLPLVMIDTEGNKIMDEPKVLAKMKIINNGTGNPHRITDRANEYDGYIGIEYRGSSSQGFDKKPFGLETRNADGTDRQVSFFGWPEEEDFILYASFNEKSLMHNVFTMELARNMGMYASRTKYVELFVNGSYEGVYVFMEKIKRDRGRVAIERLDTDENSGEDLTGGYIIKVDKGTGNFTGNWQSNIANYPKENGNRSFYFYEYPKEISDPQKNYIRAYFREFEKVMDSDIYKDVTNGYHKYIDVPSFVKFFLVNEISRNIDGYRISSFFHKDKNGRLKAGPVWDFDIAYGNANYCQGSRFDLWGYRFNELCPNDFFQVPFYWYRLMEDPTFIRSVSDVYYRERTNGVLKTEVLLEMVDKLANEIRSGQQRNFNRWPILGNYIWPQPNPVPTTWEQEVDELRRWLINRTQWLDAVIPKDFDRILSLEEEISFHVYPNPVAEKLSIAFHAEETASYKIFLYSSNGQLIVKNEGTVSKGNQDLHLTIPSHILPQSLYFQFFMNGKSITKKLVKH